MKGANPSNPQKQAELKVEEEEARSMQLHLETTTKALVEEIEELVRDKNQNLNIYVAKFLRSNMTFHKKANQQFQTLSSIDTEGHKTY